MGPIGCLETSARNYNCSLRNNPEEYSSNPLRGWSMKSHLRNCTVFLQAITPNENLNLLHCTLFYFHNELWIWRNSNAVESLLFEMANELRFLLPLMVSSVDVILSVSCSVESEDAGNRSCSFHFAEPRVIYCWLSSSLSPPPPRFKFSDLFEVGFLSTLDFIFTSHDVDPGFPTVTFNHLQPSTRLWPGW
jgi:hypothetical protein